MADSKNKPQSAAAAAESNKRPKVQLEPNNENCLFAKMSTVLSISLDGKEHQELQRSSII